MQGSFLNGGAGLGMVGGVGLVMYGYLGYHLKLQQIELAPEVPLAELKEKILKFRQQHGDEPDGFYCKVKGQIVADGKPYVAPESRKRVVIYEWKKGQNAETKQMDFFVSDGMINVKVEPKGSILSLETTKRNWGGMTIERVLQVDEPLLVIGEAFYDSHKNKITIKKPYYGRAYVVTANDESTLRWMKIYGRLYIFFGSCLFIGGVACGFKLLAKAIANKV